MKYGEHIVLNPTPKTVVAGFDVLGKGAEYTFKPFEEKKIYVAEHVHHICTSAKHEKKGLVYLNYNDEAKKLYPTYEDYKRAKAAEGLGRAIGRTEFLLTYEKQAEAAAELGKHLIDKKSMHSDRYAAELDKMIEIKASLENVSIEVEKVEEVEVPAWMGGEAKKEINTKAVGLKASSEYPKEYTVGDNKIKIFENGRIMINGRHSTKEKLEELIESRGNEN